MRAIEVKNITKSYKKSKALDDLSFSFEFGKIYGFLGRNGAGKSTLINIIANRSFADSGQVLIDGTLAKENMNVQDKIYCMSEKDLYDGDLKVKECFKWTNRFYDTFDLEKAYLYAKKFNLDTNKKIKSLSKGYQSIFKLIIALCLNIPYVIFDEPVLGLDANHRDLFYHLLLDEFEQNERTFIIATHLIEEVSNLVEEVVFIDRGKLMLQENVESLLQKGYSVSGMSNEVDAYCNGKHVIDYDQIGNLKITYILGEKTALPKGSNLQFATMSLQKLFIKMTGEGNQDE